MAMGIKQIRDFSMARWIRQIRDFSTYMARGSDK